MDTINNVLRHIDEHFSPDISGIELMRDERRRQVQDEDFKADHDDAHTQGELGFAAGCYAFQSALPADVRNRAERAKQVPGYWPWDPREWKSAPGVDAKARILDLVKAGALIASEIDRLQRIRQREEGAVSADGHATSEG